jgi:hypothetical protein
MRRTLCCVDSCVDLVDLIEIDVRSLGCGVVVVVVLGAWLITLPRQLGAWRLAAAPSARSDLVSVVPSFSAGLSACHVEAVPSVLTAYLHSNVVRIDT